MMKSASVLPSIESNKPVITVETEGNFDSLDSACHYLVKSDEKIEQKSTRPEWDDVSFISRIFFLWILPVYRNKIEWFS